MDPEVVAFLSRSITGASTQTSSSSPQGFSDPIEAEVAKPKTAIWKVTLVFGVIIGLLQAIAAFAAYSNGVIGVDTLTGRIGLSIPMVTIVMAGVFATLVWMWRKSASGTIALVTVLGLFFAFLYFAATY